MIADTPCEGSFALFSHFARMISCSDMSTPTSISESGKAVTCTSGKKIPVKKNKAHINVAA